MFRIHIVTIRMRHIVQTSKCANWKLDVDEELLIYCAFVTTTVIRERKKYSIVIQRSWRLWYRLLAVDWLLAYWLNRSDNICAQLRKMILRMKCLIAYVCSNFSLNLNRILSDYLSMACDN
jgi:hypothetical protein